MSRIFYKITTFLCLGLIVMIPLTNHAEVFAAQPPLCTSMGITLTTDKTQYNSSDNIPVTISFNGSAISSLMPDWSYDVAFLKGSGIVPDLYPKTTDTGGDGGYFVGRRITQSNPSVTLTLTGGLPIVDSYSYTLELVSVGFGNTVVRSICTGPTIAVYPNGYINTKCSVSLPKNIQVGTAHTVTVPEASLDPKNISFEAWAYKGNVTPEVFKLFKFEDRSLYGPSFRLNTGTKLEGSINPNNPRITIKDLETGSYSLVVFATYTSPYAFDSGSKWFYGCSINYFEISRNGTTGPVPSEIDPNKPTPTKLPCSNDEGSVNPCSKGGGKKVPGCSNDPDNPNPGITTAIGCIHTNPAELVKDLLTFVIGISGGLAFLMMLLGAFQMLASAGNPETLNAGRERLTSAVIGLLFVIFAILLLQIIGFRILNIPGFQT